MMKTILIILLFALPTALALAGWSEDMRLTTRGNEFYPQVIARNDAVHVAWWQFGGESQISYMNSSDGGSQWSELVNINVVNNNCSRLDFAEYNNNLLTLWYNIDTTGPGNVERNLGYSISTDGGSSWPVPSYIFDEGFDGTGNLAGDIQGNNIFVVYYSNVSDTSGYHPFRFLFSTNSGQTWSEEQTLGHGAAGASGLLLEKCQNTLYAVWSAPAPIPPNYDLEVFATTSFDSGQTWSDIYQLSSPDPYVSQLPCLACDESTGNVAVGWMAGGYPGDLFLRVTTNGGITWGDIQQATTHHMISLSNLSIAGDTIWAVWTDHDPSHGTNNREIAFSKSIDLGYSWSPHERLTYAEGMSRAPWLDYDDGKLHLVWWERNRPPYQGHDIYYKRFTPDPTAVFEDKSLPPEELSISAYPNPFNSSVNLTLNDMRGGDVEIKIYDIRGRLIRNLTAISTQGGDKKAVWDASDNSGRRLSSGIYFARVETPQTIKFSKLLYLK